jgi:hypothetical protein
VMNSRNNFIQSASFPDALPIAKLCILFCVIVLSQSFLAPTLRSARYCVTLFDSY